MIKKYSLVFAFLFLLFACEHETVFKEVKVNNRYSLAVADYLKPCADLHKDASLQYQNVEKDIYAIVIDEKKKSMIDYDLNYDIYSYYKNIASQPFIDSIKNGKISNPVNETIHGNKAMLSEITGKIEETDVFYKLCVVETSSAFYQLIMWTRADNKERFEGDMIKMIESFTELPTVKV